MYRNPFRELENQKARLEYYNLMYEHWTVHYDSEMASTYHNKSVEVEYEIDMLQAEINKPISDRVTFLVR